MYCVALAFLFITTNSRTKRLILASKFSTPNYEYSEWRTISSGTTEDGFSDDASESTDMESHSLESANFTPALSPPPTMPRKPSTISIPRSSVLSDRRAKCRMSFGLPSDNEDDEQEDDDCSSTLSDVAIWDGDRLQSMFEEQQEEIAYCRDRISRMTKNTQVIITITNTSQKHVIGY